GSVTPSGNATMRGSDLHIGLRISDGIAHLVSGAAASKDSKGGCKGDKTFQRQASRHRHHIGLLHATVEKSLRKKSLKVARLGGSGHVAVQNHDQRVLPGQFYQSVGITLSGAFSLQVSTPSEPVQTVPGSEESHASTFHFP